MIGQVQTDITILPNKRIVITEASKTDSIDSMESYLFDIKNEFQSMYANTFRPSSKLIWSDAEHHTPEVISRGSSSDLTSNRPPTHPSSFNNMSSSNFYYRDPITPIRATFQPGPLNLPSPGLSPIAFSRGPPAANESKLSRSSGRELSAQPFKQTDNSIEEAYSSPVASDDEEYAASIDNISLVRLAVGPSLSSLPKEDSLNKINDLTHKVGSKQSSVNSSPVTIGGVPSRLFPDDNKAGGTPVRQGSKSFDSGVAELKTNKSNNTSNNNINVAPVAALSQKSSSANISTASIPSILYSDVKSPAASPRVDEVRSTLNTPSNNNSMKSMHAVSYLPDTPPPLSRTNSAVSGKDFPSFSVTTPNRDRVIGRTNSVTNNNNHNDSARNIYSPNEPVRESPSLQGATTPLKGIMKQTSSQSLLVQTNNISQPLQSAASSATTVDMTDPREKNRQLVEKGLQKYGNSSIDGESLSESWSPMSPTKLQQLPQHNSLLLSQSDDSNSELRRAVISNTALNSTPAKVIAEADNDMYAQLSYHRYHQYLESTNNTPNKNSNHNNNYNENNYVNHSISNFETPVKQLARPQRTSSLKKTAAGSSISYYKAKMEKSLNEISLIDETIDHLQPEQQQIAKNGLAIGGTYKLIVASDGSPVFVPLDNNNTGNNMKNMRRAGTTITTDPSTELLNTHLHNARQNYRYTNHDGDEEEAEDIDYDTPLQPQYRQSRRDVPRYFQDDSVITYGTSSAFQQPSNISYLPETPQSTGKIFNRRQQQQQQYPRYQHHVQQPQFAPNNWRQNQQQQHVYTVPTSYYTTSQMLPPSTQSEFNDQMAFAAWKATVKATSDEYNYTSQRLESQLSIPLLHYQFPSESFLRSTYPMGSPHIPASLSTSASTELPRANVYSKNISSSLFTPKRYSTTAPTTPNVDTRSSAPVGAHYSDPESKRLSSKGQPEELLGSSEYYKERLNQRDLTSVLKSPFLSRY